MSTLWHKTRQIPQELEEGQASDMAALDSSQMALRTDFSLSSVLTGTPGDGQAG